MSKSQSEPTGLVVSAHSADFIWRAGGAIALYAKRGEIGSMRQGLTYHSHHQNAPE